MLFINTSGEIELVNDSFARMVGWRRKQCLGRNILDFLHDDDRDIAAKAWDTLTSRERDAYKVERRYRRKNGSVFWVDVAVSAVPDDSGEVAGILAQYRPIEREKRLEAAHDAAEARWRFALDGSGQGVWDVDLGKRSWYFSPGWKRMRGIPEDEEVSGDSSEWLDLIHPEDRERVADIVGRQDAGELDDISYDYREQARDGRWIWILARGHCTERDANGKPTRLIGTDTDITALKQSEARALALAKTELRWKIAVESADQGVWDQDFVTGEWFFSASCKRMRGLSEDDDFSRGGPQWLLKVHPDDCERVDDYNRRLRAGKITDIDCDYRERHADGHWVWIKARGRCVEWQDNGLPKRIVGTDTDISALKRREEELERVSRRLELALSTSQIGIWETDLKRGTTYWDEKTCGIFGHDPTRPIVVGKTWEKYVHPEDRAMVLARVEEAIGQKRQYGLDYRIVLKNGEIRHVRCRADYYQEANGEARFLGANWDVTADYEKAEELQRAYGLAEQRNVELEEARARMEHNALHDPLTGLPNRRYLDGLLAELTDKDDRKPSDVAVLNIDLDRFKQINDTLGHAAGDAMLKHMGRLLTDSVRKADTVARIGGDEFVIVLTPAPSAVRLKKLIARIIKQASRPMVFHGQECRGGVSVGIAFSEEKGADARQLLVNSDIALYRAKGEGRNRAVVFTHSLQAEVIATKRCADDILKGLERGEFLPHYQPQFDAHTLDVVGVEALVRWQHPRDGLLLPDRFLKVAEDLNAVSAIDRTVFEQSIGHFKKWRRVGLLVPHVSVNVSARRLGDEGLVESLRALDIEPGVFSFELLESIFLDDRDDVAGWNIDRIRELGINIDIDDFGTGHASIVSLLRLNPQRLKIDRQIVEPITRSEQQRRLVRSIVEIGKSLGIEVCAEGVETLDHVHILRDLGCDVLQGFFFAKPMAFADLIDFLRQQDWRAAS